MSQSQIKNQKTCRQGKPGQSQGHTQTQRSIKLSVSEGQVGFRLLCSLQVAGGVIGHAGTIVKRLERETSGRIQVEDAVSGDCTERIIHVVGAHQIDRSLRIADEVFDVSVAQTALIRVFERVLEVSEDDGSPIVRCRLLLGPGMAGAVIGGGGKRISKVAKDTTAHMKVFPAGSLPPCAASSDELLQITGSSLAVKKALVIVSRYIQPKASQGAGPSLNVFHQRMQMSTNDVRINDKLHRKAATEVVFRLLCPFDAAGAVIGWKGKKVKALEDETGASISFSAPEASFDERVITVTSFENKESHYSSAQNAILRIFNELTSSVGRGIVSVRLLIHPDQARWLTVGESSTISSIQKVSDAKLQILEQNYICGSAANERIFQIDGDYSNVLIALFQASWRLRENYFNTSVAPFVPQKLVNPRSYLDGTTTLTDKMTNCRVSDVNIPLPHKFPQSQFTKGNYAIDRENPKNLGITDGDSEDNRKTKGFHVTNTMVEIMVHEDMIGCVYGDSGSNLSRLRQISGATVEVQDPSPGGEGKVIISGTPDQVLAAQSLLRAFMMSAL